MAKNIIILTDHAAELDTIRDPLRKYLFVEEFSLDADGDADLSRSPVLVISIDLKDPAKIAQFRDFCSRHKCTGTPKVFITENSRQQELQAANLGAKQSVPRPIKERQLFNAIGSVSLALKGFLTQKPNESLAMVQRTFDTLQSIAQQVGRGEGVAKAEVSAAASEISSVVASEGVLKWLNAVNLHHSYSFRHSLHVTGLMIAFAEHLKFGASDKIKMTIGALMHDVGKAMIPLAILDKDGALSVEETSIMRTHPRLGAEILRSNGDWDELTLDLVLHHHEMLDGTGYPNGLRGVQISDPVRMLTIADIFSALVDKRAYKDAMPPERALHSIFQMTGKLDRALLQAFEPVALRLMASIKSLELAA